MTLTHADPPVVSEATEKRPIANVAPEAIEVSPDDAALLLRLARSAVAAAAHGEAGAFDPGSVLAAGPPAALVTPAAVFVTLRDRGELRGCIGSLVADRPLWKAVVSAAISAASHDPRFPPVAEHEIPSLSIDVSILGAAVPLVSPGAFRPGIDGLIVERGLRRGLLLPEVATDQGWNAREMLAATCWKAGLPMSAWHDPETRVLAFRTTRISDAQKGDAAASW